ncbi:MAG: hypothetical protein HXY24_17965 [Rubrivivax sp.]|nr:hypothetical protein [Rubrivivax sp.]
MPSVRLLAASLMLVTCGTALAVDARERSFLRTGMPEGEVVYRVGQPDHETFIRNVKGQPEEKAWTYFPHPRDPQTLTIVTIRGGIVTNVERKISR